MKYALYGNDIDDAHTPLEAGLGWIVKMDKGDFVGPLGAGGAEGRRAPAQAGGLRDARARHPPSRLRHPEGRDSGWAR